MPAASRNAYHPALIALGAAIRTARVERGISQEDLAHISDVDRAYLSRIERGAQNPSVLTLLRVVGAMEMTATELFVEARL